LAGLGHGAQHMNQLISLLVLRAMQVNLLNVDTYI